MSLKNYDEIYFHVGDSSKLMTQANAPSIQIVKPTELVMLKLLLGPGLVNSNIRFLNTRSEGKLRIFRSNLLDSIVVEGKYLFLKMLLTFEEDIFLEFLGEFVVDGSGTKLKR